MTLNENYITLLSKVIDWNIDDMQLLISKVKSKDEGGLQQHQRSSDGAEIIEEVPNGTVHDASNADNHQQKYNFERIFEGNLSSIEHVMALNNFDFT